MNENLRRYLIIGVVFYGLLFSFRACNSKTDASLFTGAPFGPGGDLFGATGTLVPIEGEDGEAAFRLRIAPASLRVQSPEAAPLGRIRVATGGWEFLDRTGTVICTGADAAEAHPALLIAQCGENTWSLRATSEDIVLQSPEGLDTVIPPLVDAPPLRIAGREWSDTARAVVRSLAHPPADLTSEAARATLLLAWLARDLERAPALDAPIVSPESAIDAPSDDAPPAQVMPDPMQESPPATVGSPKK